MRCERRGDTIMGLRNGTECWCGNEYPSWEDGLDEQACHLRCPGYARDICEFLCLLTESEVFILLYVKEGC
ncbi:uncharacterized protein BDV14DRAFT_161682 [Aspergillus stella-maris]|uniref:uncharacterized protein n=1 Tax=Aspergillus stella-maris TaxID=1810926 RepID=UPI003CCCC242